MKSKQESKTMSSTEHSPLTPQKFDALTMGGEEKIWGLVGIAHTLGISVDKARVLAKQPETPIYRPPGACRYFALRSELMGWLRTK